MPGRRRGLALQRQIERLDGWPGNLFDCLLGQQRVRASPTKAGTCNPPPQPCGMLSRYGCGLTAIHQDDRSPNPEGSYPCPYGPSTSRAGEGSSSVVRVVRTRFPAHIARQATTSAPDRSGIGHWRLLPDASMPGRQGNGAGQRGLVFDAGWRLGIVGLAGTLGLKLVDVSRYFGWIRLGVRCSKTSSQQQIGGK